ncbi:hypothetical protein MHB77_09165 [Paenibacillus sp. FSL K6-3166]|uniref:hypothetical protein n=1 Tax=unclassified Paenibacillus TaxID=185978 RepID=UPI0011800573|nr:hypothetical protein [Paenibacillus sp. VTT E-133291]
MKNVMIAIEVNKVSVERMMFLLAGLELREGSDRVMNTDALMLASFKSDEAGVCSKSLFYLEAVRTMD